MNPEETLHSQMCAECERFTLKEKMQIGKHAVEHGLEDTFTDWHFSKTITELLLISVTYHSSKSISVFHVLASWLLRISAPQK